MNDQCEEKRDEKTWSERTDKGVDEIVQNHPAFARAFLFEQAILMQASILGHKMVDQSMSKLIEAGLPVLFEDFWTARNEELTHDQVLLEGLLGCLSDSSRDPSRCFPPLHDFFDDPLAGGRVLPPKGPDPHF